MNYPARASGKPTDSRWIHSRGSRAVFACILLASLPSAYADPTSPPPADSLDSANVSSPANAPGWFLPAYLHALRSPLPVLIDSYTTPATIAQFEIFPDRAGLLSNYQPGGPTLTANNAFFLSLGTNGRSCLTCHQPSQAMSVSAAYVREVFAATGGRDPLFAPVDGANCPNRVPEADTSGALRGGRSGSATLTDSRAAHSLLLDKGLFRIFLPVPKQTTELTPGATEYTIEVVSDPNGCNTDPAYNQQVDPATGEVTRIISVYRRPLMTANLKFKTTTLTDAPHSPFLPLDPETGGLLPIDPFTGQYESLNIMWDGREPTLESQASDAVLIHSQATAPPTTAQVAQMVAFENGIYSAQAKLGPVTLSLGASGGAMDLSALSPLTPTSLGTVPFQEFDAWNNISGTTPTAELQASIARGQQIFETFPFVDPQNPLATATTCSSCHAQPGGGENTIVAAQINNGIGGQSVNLNGPAPDPSLPIFKLTCVPGVEPSTDGTVVITNDPGLALITGRCRDIGAFTVPPIRGLAARAPYFHNGSAATILDVVNFYDQRFTIGFTAQQKQDLVNFLGAL